MKMFNSKLFKSINSFYFLLGIFALLSTLFPRVLFGELPELIPRAEVFNIGGIASPQISPDGVYTSRLNLSDKGVMNVWIKPVKGGGEQMVTREEKVHIFEYYWAFDNKHILYLNDTDGDENFHVFSHKIGDKSAVDITPFKGAKAQNILMCPSHPNEVLVGLNIRDKHTFDMYRIDLWSGKCVMVAENPGDVRWWLADHDLVVRGAVAIDPKDSSTTLRVRDSIDKPWRNLIHWGFGETGLLEGYGSEMALAFSKDGKSIYVQAAFDGDQTEIGEVDALSGRVLKIVASDPKASVWDQMKVTLYSQAAVLFHPQTGKFQAAAFNYFKPEWKAYDGEMKGHFERLNKLNHGAFSIDGRDINDKLWVVSYFSDCAPGVSYLYDTKSGKAEVMYAPKGETGTEGSVSKKYEFSAMEAVTIKARDGMDIPCYLSLPLGVRAERLPMVVNVHGGPWSRDEWGFDGFTQLLANRGYAVLKVNFRGSTGFGKKFLNAGIGEMGVGSMQHDITDAVEWFISKGIADPKRIGIVGGSYGGYAVLSGLAFTPDLYVCGIDMNGPSNMKSSLESFPDWWGPVKVRWIQRIGKEIMNGDAFNEKISPYFHVDKIKGRLMIMHGVNDPRVKIQESNGIVECMRKNKKEVVYLVYPDEGHGVNRPQNIMDMLGRIEEFLAKNLGGRLEPVVKIPGCSVELR